jgi:hypothetical protein
VSFLEISLAKFVNFHLFLSVGLFVDGPEPCTRAIVQYSLNKLNMCIN